MTLEDRKTLFLLRAAQVHNGKYKYDMSSYKSHSVPMTITCLEHGEFHQTPNRHLAGNGCKLCAQEARSKRLRLTREEFVSRAKEIHGDKYRYEKTVYGRNSSEKVIITCPQHGDFLQSPNKHIHSKHGCPKCGEHTSHYTREQFISIAAEKHGNFYDYSNVKYTDSHGNVEIICPVHGSFYQTPHNHIHGEGCLKCGIESSRKKQLLSQDEFESQANIAFNNKYRYGTYNGIQQPIEIICPVHGPFVMTAYRHRYNHQECPKCIQSKPQEQLRLFLDSLAIDYVENDRKTIAPWELDFYLPKYQLAIEVNGLYWHSTKYKAKDYHRNKYELCRDKGITLLQFWHHEIGPLVYSMIKAKLGLIRTRLYARKTKVENISSSLYREFLRENHIQGAINSSERKGLIYNESLVAVMGFSRVSHLDRAVSAQDMSVVGGFTKLLASFNKKEVLSFSANRYSAGNVYLVNGFSLIRDNKYTLYYTDGTSLYSRNKFQRHKLHGIKQGESVKYFLERRGIYEIYGPGTTLWRHIND